MNISPSHIAAVAFPMAIAGMYDYSIPERFVPAVLPGTAVFVELKNRKVWGVAVSRKKRLETPEPQGST